MIIMNPYLELIRINNCIMASIACAIGFFIISPVLNFNLLFASLVVFFVCAGGQAINDYYDFDIDKKINKKKVLPSKKIKRNTALYFSLILFIIGVLISTLISTFAFIIALIFAFLLLIYASNLYKTKYVGNAVVALGTAFTFIFGAVSAGNISNLILVFAVSAFFANMAREITKDFEDIKKDTGFKRTLPMISKKLGKLFIIVYNLLAIIFSLIALIVFSLSIVYLFFVLLTTIFLGKNIRNILKNDFHKASSESKKAMLFSLIAFFSTIFR
jgi:geranylgeranylglycerol-phosphate geranylgeranyltransferase